jgi:uncharacterized protein with LGFP repeats
VTRTRLLRAARRATLLALALAVLGGLLVLPDAPSQPRLAPAADAMQFNPGNIVSDAVFFDRDAMDAREVQTFLDAKGAGCRVGSDGSPCLRLYRQDTPDKAATSYCRAYDGLPRESAADIIAKVGAACGISQRAILVLLQKEQGLVRTTNPTAKAYLKAMGYACPDTRACDPAYGGFFHQVYGAASRFQDYRARPNSFNHRAGATNFVRHHPNAACGGTQVYIQNQATAGLYNYTPYQPNAAALRAGYAEGDSCSAYGNRNFWLYFTDWFGTTQSPGGGEVTARWTALGGAGGPLGAAVSPVGCRLRDGGCYQDYQHGSIHWSPRTGPFVTRGWISDRWRADGRESGSLGYPLADEETAAGGAVQRFQYGTVYSSAAGPKIVRGWVLDRYVALGGPGSPLGHPTGEEVGTSGGVRQQFQGGVVYSSASTGAHAVWGAVLDKWTAMGREKGILGFPTSDEVRTRNGAYGSFQRGGVFASSAGAFEMHGWIWDRWVAAGAGSAAVGFPTSDERRAPDGRGAFNTFSNGVVYSSAATGAHEVVGAVAQKWLALGGPGSFLGYPVAAPKALTGKGTVSRFQHGWIYASPGTGAHPVHGWIGALWQSMGYERSALGYPTSGEQRAPDGVGVFQTFTGGVVYSSPRGGARAVQGPIEDKWTRLGGLSSWIGPPVTNQLTMPDGRGRASVFASGAAIYWSPGTGAFEVHGWIRDLYSSLGAERSFLGYPTSDETPVAGTPAVVATFQGGRIYSSPRTGAREVHGLILGRYLQLGGPTSALGLPTSNEYGVRDGRRSDFQHGSITFNSRTGALTVTTR